MSLSGKHKFITNVVFVALILSLGYVVVKYLAVWLMPFIVGFALAVMLQSPVNWVLRHSRLKRNLVAPLVTLILVLLIVAMVILLLFLAMGETVKIAATLPGWLQKNMPYYVYGITSRLEVFIQNLPREWETQVRELVYSWLKMMQSRVGEMSADLIPMAANMAAHLPNLLVCFIITVVATFFICSEYEQVKSFICRQVPGKYQELAGDTWATFANTLGQMIKSYLLIMLITFCELAIGLTLMRVNYAILLAALISLVDIFPVIGTGSVLIPWGILGLLTGNMAIGVGVLLLYVIITVIRNILEPKIVGKRIGLHPLATLIFMYLGLHVFGVPGIFLFPIIFILLKHAQEAGMIRLWKQ